jgi:3-hydroxy-3-methylglutaryl CoA synthase
MAGILAYGAYIPFYRLQRAAIGAALETKADKGERAVASFDEDTVTMAVEAARVALAGAAGTSPSSLFFATTDAPYQEKLNAATIHAALDLPAQVRALDIGGSVRAGLGAFLMAADASANGPALVAMSDLRQGAPEGAVEQSGGDAAAAFVIGAKNGIAEIEASYSETLEHQALWRLPGERFSRVWEERFALTQVYGPLLAAGGKGVLKKAGLSGADITRAVIDAPNARAAAGVLKALGLAPEKLVDPLLGSIGHTGTAHAGLLLACALDTAKPGDRILVISVSDGVDAIILKVTPAISAYTNAAPIAKLLSAKRNDLSYLRYLKWRGILQTEKPRRPDPDRPAAPPVFRRRHWKFSFVGTECTQCGARHLPPQKVCVQCGAVDQMKEIGFASRRGKVATYAIDRLAFTPQPPMVMAIVDFEGGGRVELEVTDCQPERVEIGMELEMTFRRFFTADGVHNYFWKARPVR